MCQLHSIPSEMASNEGLQWAIQDRENLKSARGMGEDWALAVVVIQVGRKVRRWERRRIVGLARFRRVLRT